MNYRHAFHAGNFADVMKHALLAALIEQFKQKDKPFVVVDVFAGDGLYALTDPAMDRGREYERGIHAALDSPEPALAAYLERVREHRLYPAAKTLAHYPGSPLIARELLREHDRLILSDLSEDCVSSLRQLFHDDKQVTVHHQDGYQACRALLPPTPRRGLLLIDPPFERVDEFQAMVKALQEAERKWNTGVFALWYPIKQRTPVRAFHRALADAGFEAVLACELSLKPLDNFTLTGSGLVIVNTPWRFDETAREVLAACQRALSAHEAHVQWVVPPENGL